MGFIGCPLLILVFLHLMLPDYGEMVPHVFSSDFSSSLLDIRLDLFLP